ncbi:DEAD-box ATP-dependent RNA helicase 58, chloroplastic, partial [Cucurbita argyrosperma subsp. sororia]
MADFNYAFISLVVLLPLALLIFLYLIVRPRSVKIPLKNRHVFITGGSSGIGLALAHQAASEGARVSILARSLKKLEEAKDAIRLSTGIDVAVFAADVRDYDAISKAVDEAGPIDVLVVNQGVFVPQELAEQDMDEVKFMLDVNLLGAFHMIKAALPTMKNRVDRRPASIALMSSQAGQVGVYGYTAYSASKFGLRGLAEALQQEVIGDNIHISLIFPPDTDTPGLVEEEKKRPELTNIIAAGGGRMKAELVAKKALNGIKSGLWACVFNGFGMIVFKNGMHRKKESRRYGWFFHNNFFHLWLLAPSSLLRILKQLEVKARARSDKSNISSIFGGQKVRDDRFSSSSLSSPSLTESLHQSPSVMSDSPYVGIDKFLSSIVYTCNAPPLAEARRRLLHHRRRELSITTRLPIFLTPSSSPLSSLITHPVLRRRGIPFPMAATLLPSTKIPPPWLPVSSERRYPIYLPKLINSNGPICSTPKFRPLKAFMSSSSLNNAVDSNFEASSLREICNGYVPDHILDRAEEIGFVAPTGVQRQALPVLFSGRDCVLHAQTGSGKTLTYLLLIFSVINAQKSAVQALIVVPTRELGIQVTKVARMLAAKPATADEVGEKSYVVMALLDGGLLRRHKTWLKADPPSILVATVGSLCQMVERRFLDLASLKVLIIDEVDFMFSSSKQVSSLKKILTSYSMFSNRQTVFASASIPQHRHFLQECIQQKWTKNNVIHVHINAVQPMPSCLLHRFVMCDKNKKHQTFLRVLLTDKPQSAIIFVSEQSERSKKAGKIPPATLMIDFLKTSYDGCSDVVLLDEDVNFNSRAASLSEVRQGGSYLIVATDLVARGIDLPETTHIYNFDLPQTAIDYLHRAGRTGRKPFSEDKCMVTNLITSVERFVLQKFENELLFTCDELVV